MKTSFKAVATLVLVLSGTLASGAAMAQHRGHGHGHGGGVRFGVSFGFPVYSAGFYPGPYFRHAAPVYTYPAPVYAYPAPAYAYPGAAVSSYSAPAYVEQSPPPATPAPSQAQTQGDWYYCAASRSYYPYATECNSGWQRVPAQPSR